MLSTTDISPLIGTTKPPISIKRGAKGFGFTVRSVRVYLSEDSDYYTIQHIAANVEIGSPAFEAGLRSDDLITHANGESIQNLTHPQLMHRLLTAGDTLNLKANPTFNTKIIHKITFTLQVTPLASTSIKTGAARKQAGKLARRRQGTLGHKQSISLQRRALEKKKNSAGHRGALLRRLSNKRTNHEQSGGSLLYKDVD